MSGLEFLPFQTKIMCSKFMDSRSFFEDVVGSRKLSRISKFTSLLERGFSSPRGVRLLYDSTIPHIE